MNIEVILKTRISIIMVTALLISSVLMAQETPLRYKFDKVVNIDYSHGQLPLTTGVHNIQILRASRAYSELTESFGWTYNHAAMIAYWNNEFFISYLSNPVGEHMAPGQTYLQKSSDGYSWKSPVVLFPIYPIPDGTTKEGVKGVAKGLDAVMHQRMGFYVSKRSNRLFALGYYGICMDMNDKPNDGKGIGRVVREIKKDGSFGDIFFIRYNEGWNSENTNFPFYEESPDKEFKDACQEMLSDPLVTLQWVEESDRGDVIIPKLNKNAKSFCYYPLSDGRIVGMWKSRLSGISQDGGKTWKLGKSPGLFTGSAKMWGQATSDGRFAQVFNPSVYRWPMAVSVSEDGLFYDNLSLIHGDISPMRYSGHFKSHGPQYLRGILPGNGIVPDQNMWLTYSVNKEDIWIARVTVPIMSEVSTDINEDLSKYSHLDQLLRWNIYSPLWAQVALEEYAFGKVALKLSDQDPYDYAKVTHLFPDSENFMVDFSIIPCQDNNGELQIELQNEESSPAVRISFDPDGMIRTKTHYKYEDIMPYKSGLIYDIMIEVKGFDQEVLINVNGNKISNQFFAPMRSFSQIVFRTGGVNRSLNPDTPARQAFDLKNADIMEKEASFFLLKLKSRQGANSDKD